jgi:hypothetical protein
MYTVDGEIYPARLFFMKRQTHSKINMFLFSTSRGVVLLPLRHTLGTHVVVPYLVTYSIFILK